jgi:hypothetical protein
MITCIHRFRRRVLRVCIYVSSYMGEMRNLFGKPQGNRPFGKSGHYGLDSSAT